MRKKRPLAIAWMIRLTRRTRKMGAIVKTKPPIFLKNLPKRVLGSGRAAASSTGSCFLPWIEASIGTKVSATNSEAMSAKVTVNA
jgi:hypothetical protein